jgi:phage terminase small subunit
MMEKLKNAKHERFCQEFVVDLNATQAYIRAGYSENGAAQSAATLLRNPKISARIAEIQARIMQRLEITQETVVRDIADIVEEARKVGQYSAALKGKELLGKHIGMWPAKSEVTVNVFDRMTPDDERAVEDALEALARETGRDASGAPRTTH